MANFFLIIRGLFVHSWEASYFIISTPLGFLAAPLIENYSCTSDLSEASVCKIWLKYGLFTKMYEDNHVINHFPDAIWVIVVHIWLSRNPIGPKEIVLLNATTQYVTIYTQGSILYQLTWQAQTLHGKPELYIIMRLLLSCQIFNLIFGTLNLWNSEIFTMGCWWLML